MTTELAKKTKKLSEAEFQKLNVIDPKQLLQKAITNLYLIFTNNEISGQDNKKGVFLDRNYQFIIKEGGSYDLVTSPVLLQWFVVDDESYIFPSQYHFSEINVGKPSYNRYYTRKEIEELQQKYDKEVIDGPRTFEGKFALNDKIIPGEAEFNAIFKDLVKYNSYPSVGINSFLFLKGIGVINGSYDSSLGVGYESDEIGKISFIIKKINGRSPEQIDDVKRSYNIFSI